MTVQLRRNTQLVRINNAQGIIIPKSLIEQAHLEGKELKFQVVKNGLLITPESTARNDWKQKTEQVIMTNGHEISDKDWLELS